MSKPRAGIYRLTIDRAGKPARHYIGQSSNMIARKNAHLRALRAGIHDNAALQCAFAKYGESAFSFGVVLICERRTGILTMYEQAVVDSYDADLLFNMKIQCVDSSLGIRASDERKAKIARAITGLRRSTETRAKVGLAQAWKRTPEGRIKMSDAQKNKAPPSDQTRAKMSASHYRRSLGKNVIQRGSAWMIY